MKLFDSKNKCIFIHIPKTGGTSVEQVSWFDRGGMDHSTIQELYDTVDSFNEKVDIKPYFKFCFVRDPYTRFMSGVVNHMLRTRHVPNDMEKRDVETEKEEVTKFVLENKNNFNNIQTLREQNHYVTIDGVNIMDFIGRFENIDEDWKKVCKLLKVKHEPLQHLMVGLDYNYDDLYTKETRKIVRDFFEKDFEMFGYDRGNI